MLSSISANTGTAPAQTTAPGVAKNVHAGTITLSPGPMPAALRATTNDAVPEVTPNVYSIPIFLLNAFSNSLTLPNTFGP